MTDQHYFETAEIDRRSDHPGRKLSILAARFGGSWLNVRRRMRPASKDKPRLNDERQRNFEQ